MLIAAVMLLLLKVNPLTAFAAMFQGAFGDVSAITQTLVKATPLLLVGLGVCIAFRGGVINIGGEGQLVVGALAASAVALSLPDTSRILLLPLAMMAGAVAGGMWGGIPGILKARLGVNEILSTVMMNAIAIQLCKLSAARSDDRPGGNRSRYAHRPISAAAKSGLADPPGAAYALAQRRHSCGYISGLVYIFLWRTTIGYRIRAVGLNPDAARYAGIRVPFYQALSLILGGAFAGLAGAVEVMGVQHRMLEGLSGGYGFSGIVAALFGKLHPLGAIPASVFLAVCWWAAIKCSGLCRFLRH